MICFYGVDLNSNCNERHIIFHFNFSLHKMLNIKPSLTAGSSLLHCLSSEQPTDSGKHQIFSSSISDQCVPWWWVLLIAIPCWSRADPPPTIRQGLIVLLYIITNENIHEIIPSEDNPPTIFGCFFSLLYRHQQLYQALAWKAVFDVSMMLML